MPRVRIWNEKNLAILRRLYPTFTSGDIADVIGCSDVSVRNKAHELGLKKDSSFRQYDYVGRYTGKRDPNKRQERDHERYLRQRDERLERQRAYYQANRETILRKARNRYLK